MSASCACTCGREPCTSTMRMPIALSSDTSWISAVSAPASIRLPENATTKVLPRCACTYGATLRSHATNCVASDVWASGGSAGVSFIAESILSRYFAISDATTPRALDDALAPFGCDASRCSHPAQPAPLQGATGSRAAAGHHLSRGIAGLGPARGHRTRDRSAPGRHRQRRDRLGQDDATAEDLPRRSAAANVGSSAIRSRAASRPRASRAASQRNCRRRWVRWSATRSASPTRPGPGPRSS